jgi:hypothetical protein
MDTLGDRQAPSMRFWLRKSEFLKLIPREGPVPKVVNRRLIADRDKADGIGKALALLQAFSMVIQCLLRKIQGLTVTLLEFHVVLQVLCAALIYFFWWFKPQGVIEPIPIIDSPSTTEREDRRGEAEEIPISLSPIDMKVPGEVVVDIPTSSATDEAEGATTLAPPGLFSRSTLDEIRKRLKDWISDGKNNWRFDLEILDDPHTIDFATYSIYGALHSIAWYSSFPAPIEQLLWRISCVSLVVTPLLFAAQTKLVIKFDLISPFMFSLAVILLVYLIICRAYLTIECFISLRLLPVNAYDTVVFERIWPTL